MGLPSLALFDAEGTLLVTVPYQVRSVEGLLAIGARAEQFVKMRTAVADGDPASRAPFLLMQLEEGQLELAAAKSLRQQVPGSTNEKVRAAIDERLVDLDVATALRASGQAGRAALGPRFLEMLRKGPKPSVHVSRGFHYAMLEWAERERDAAAFREALSDMTRVLAITDPGKPWVEPLLVGYRQKLTELERARR